MKEYILHTFGGFRKIKNVPKREVLINVNSLEGEMMSKKEEIEKLKTIGYVTRDEAALLTGRQPGGNIPEVLENAGVGYVSLSGKRDCRMYLKSDLSKVPHPKVTKRDASIISADYNMIIDMIADLESRIKRIEIELSGAV